MEMEEDTQIPIVLRPFLAIVGDMINVKNGG